MTIYVRISAIEGFIDLVADDDTLEICEIECDSGASAATFLTLVGIVLAYAKQTGRTINPPRFSNERLERIYNRRWASSDASSARDASRSSSSERTPVASA